MWKRELATEACDPEIWAELHPPKVEVAAVEVRTVTVRKTLDAEALFGFDEANLTEEARGTLGGLANQIEETSVIGVAIVGHTDRIGPEEYNLKLSERRAEAVAAYLREETDTIPDANIEMMGVGPAEPVVACEGLRGSSLVECLKPNRRVVVEITTELEQETEIDETIKETR
jgi:OOP family OmpA-OmpF porin